MSGLNETAILPIVFCLFRLDNGAAFAHNSMTGYALYFYTPGLRCYVAWPIVKILSLQGLYSKLPPQTHKYREHNKSLKE